MNAAVRIEHLVQCRPTTQKFYTEKTAAYSVNISLYSSDEKSYRSYSASILLDSNNESIYSEC